MDIQNRRALKNSAARALTVQTYPPRQLALIHGAVTALAMLALAGVDFFLSQQVNNTGGLSGMGTRSVLQTIQTVMQYAVSFLLPFWQIGFLYAAIRMARGRQAQPADLAEGLRRFGPVFRLRLTRGLVFAALAIASCQVSSFVYSFTPMGQVFMEEVIRQLPASYTVEDMMLTLSKMVEGMSAQEQWQTFWPLLVFFGMIFSFVAVHTFYRFRFAEFVVMDQPRIRAIPALIRSSRMTRGIRFQVFRLDLSFWWYYLVYVLALLVGYADLLLKRMGIALPVSEDAAYFLTYGLSLLVQMILFAFAGSKLHTTWAVAYDGLKPPEEEK